MYKKYIKRVLDFTLSLLAITVLSPVFVILIITGAAAMHGNPFFVQPRPGKIGKNGNEKIFKLIKFRTMSNRRDKDGRFLPDEVRLNGYGRFLRSTSLDELPELINILKGDMSIVGPRPQLVRDMVFMTSEQRQRHSVKPGLSGLAQISGRNNISWERKLSYDLEYIKNITFCGDAEIVIKTLWKAFISRENISSEGMETSEDLGDYLLRIGKVNDEIYVQHQWEAKEFLNEGEWR